MKKGGDRLKERKFAYIFVAVLAGVLLIGTAVLAAWNASEYANAAHIGLYLRN